MKVDLKKTISQFQLSYNLATVLQTKGKTNDAVCKVHIKMEDLSQIPGQIEYKEL